MNQQQLFDTPQEPKSSSYDRLKDYIGLFPKGVMPTRDIDVLEKNGRLLFVKNYAHQAPITDAQRVIWRLLVRLGELEDAPGGVTVACVWGTGDIPRQLIVFNYQGESPPDQLSQQAFRAWLHDWWESAR